MNKTSKIILAILVLVIIVVLIVILYKPAPKGTIKIGAILPLTGTQAYIGQDMKEGIDLAVEEFNNQGGVNRKLIEVVYEDSQGDPKIAISSFNKLKGFGDINLFITTLSHVTLALAPLAEEAKNPMFTIAVSPSILDAGEYIFVNNFNGEQELGYLIDFIISKFQYKKLAIIAQNVEFGIQYRDVLERKWREKNGLIVATELFDSSATDYRTQLTKIKNADPDFIYVVGYAPHIARVLVQSKELGIQKRLFSYWGAQEKSLLDTAKETAEGLIFPSSPFSQETVSYFFEKYKPKYNREPHYRAGLSYDIIGILLEALKKCDTDSSKTVCIKEKIYAIEDYPGVTGLTSVTPEGGTTKEIVIWEVKNGQFVPYEE